VSDLFDAIQLAMWQKCATSCVRMQLLWMHELARSSAVLMGCFIAAERNIAFAVEKGATLELHEAAGGGNLVA